MSETGSEGNGSIHEPRAATPDHEIVFRRDMRENGSDDEEAGQGDVPIRDEFRGQDAVQGFLRLGAADKPPHPSHHDRNPVNREFPNEPRFLNQLTPAPRYGNVLSNTTIKPEPYNGKDSWEEYISHFENCSELGRWAESEKVLLLAASFRGPARTFYISLTQNEKRSYYLLVRNMEQRFGNARHQNRWLSRFETRTRQSHESIVTFGDDLRQMAQKAYSNLDTRAQEVLALNQLYKNISLEMKCRCIDKECRNVSEAVDLIERYEALLGDPNDRKKGNIRQIGQMRENPERTSNAAPPTNHSTDDSIIRQLMDRIERLEKPSQRNTRSCFSCNSPDHFYRDCPTNKRRTDQNRQFNQGYKGQRYYTGNQTSQKQQQLQGNGNPSAYQA